MNNYTNVQNFADEQQELLVKAFELAFFIYPDKNIAIEVTSNAFEMWEVICGRQEKRRYYNLKGRLLGNQERKKQRVKINMQEEQLLQRLIYKLLEEYELTPNWHKTVNEESLLICYLKRLISIVLKRNSFSVTVGIGRVLHKYSNRETVDLYISLAPNRTTQDLANLERESKRYKSKLMDQLKDSFNGLIMLSKKENEERFEIVNDPTKFALLFNVVEDCLDRFKPWATECSNSFSNFIFNGDNPDNEHLIELKRIHSIIHYSCYTQIMASLNLTTPKTRLEIPQFVLSENSNDKYNGKENDHNRRHPPDVTAELSNIAKKLAEASKRRKNALTSLLSIVVDGEEKEIFNPITESYKHFQISEDAEIIEIRNKADGLLLLTHLLTQEGFGYNQKPQNYQIKLEGGQIIKLQVSFVEHLQTDEERKIYIDVWYKETSLPRVLNLIWKKFIYRITNPNKIFVYSFSRSQVAITLAIFTAIIFSLYFYFNSIKNLPKQEPLITKDGITTPKPNTVVRELPFTTPSPSPNRKELVEQKPLPKNPKQNPRATFPVVPPDFIERGDVAKNLSSVEKIYINFQNEPYQKDIESFITQKNMIKIVEFVTEADAVLQYSNKKKSFILVNKERAILWQKRFTITDATTKEDIIDAIGDLFKEIEKVRNKQ